LPKQQPLKKQPSLAKNPPIAIEIANKSAASQTFSLINLHAGKAAAVAKIIPGHKEKPVFPLHVLFFNARISISLGRAAPMIKGIKIIRANKNNFFLSFFKTPEVLKIRTAKPDKMPIVINTQYEEKTAVPINKCGYINTLF
jgi:hypothetical protein